MIRRLDIDGLRLIAIVSVLLFHFKIAFCSAGFLGVDLFFVISGYLIVGSSLANVANLSDVGDFFRRRIARILPLAVFVWSAALIAWTYVNGLATDQNVIPSAWAANFFYANLFFAKNTDYFRALSEANPFSHAWSLSVEEQFYLFIPFVLLFFKRRGWVFLFLISGSLAYVFYFANPTDGFYLLPARVWEFGVGAWLAGLPEKEKPPTKSESVVGLLISLILLGCAFRFMRADVAQSPLYRLLPVGAAALFIWSGMRANFLSDRIFGARWLAGLGRLSYSAYLIHLPLYFFALEYFEDDFTRWQSAGLILAVFAVSFLLHRLLEFPAQRAIRRLSVATALLVGVGLLAISGLVIVGVKHLRPPLSEAALAQIDELKAVQDKSQYYEIYETGRCFLDPTQFPKDYPVAACVIQPNAKPRVMIWGDSFGAHRLYGLKKSANDRYQVFQGTSATCPPLMRGAGVKCELISGFFIQEIILKSKPDLVLMAGRWNRDLQSMGVDGLKTQLGRTLQFLRSQGVKVALIGQSPMRTEGVPLVLAKMVSRGEHLGARTEIHEQVFTELNSALSRVAKENNVPFFDPTTSLCRDLSCLVAIDGHPMYGDYGHMTARGSEFAGQAIEPWVANLLLK